MFGCYSRLHSSFWWLYDVVWPFFVGYDFPMFVTNMPKYCWPLLHYYPQFFLVYISLCGIIDANKCPDLRFLAFLANTPFYFCEIGGWAALWRWQAGIKEGAKQVIFTGADKGAEQFWFAVAVATIQSRPLNMPWMPFQLHPALCWFHRHVFGVSSMVFQRCGGGQSPVLPAIFECRGSLERARGWCKRGHGWKVVISHLGIGQME